MGDEAQPLLILDLDETLIHATEKPLPWAPEFRCGPYEVHLRPGLADFLEACARHFQLAVWTASTRDYATEVCSRLPFPRPLNFLWARDRCVQRYDHDTAGYQWLKDLKKVRRQGYDLQRVLVLDDTPEKLARSYGNHVPILPFQGDPEDRELGRVLPFLVELADHPRVRTVEKRRWWER